MLVYTKALFDFCCLACSLPHLPYLPGGLALGAPPLPNPAPDWMSHKSWGELCRASDLGHEWQGLATHIAGGLCSACLLHTASVMERNVPAEASASVSLHGNRSMHPFIHGKRPGDVVLLLVHMMMLQKEHACSADQPRSVCVPLLHHTCPLPSSITSISDHLDEWRLLFDSTSPHLEPLPAAWQARLGPFQRLLLIRALRQDKLTQAISKYMADTMGR